MNKSEHTYISLEEFERKLSTNDLYSGFVIGEGYAYYAPKILYQSSENIIGDNPNSSFLPSECIVVWIQYLDTTPEMKMKSLGEDTTKWSDFFGSTKLQRFAAKEFAAANNGIVVDENKSSIHVLYTFINPYNPDMKVTHKQYFNEDGTLISQHGEIKPHNPNLWEKMHTSRAGQTWVGKIMYGIIDDAYITIQCFTIGHINARHLSRRGVEPGEPLEAGISTLTSFIPLGNLGKGTKVMNVAQFNSLYKGTGINTIKESGTRMLRQHNMNVREFESFRKVYNWVSYPSTAIPYIIEDGSNR